MNSITCDNCGKAFLKKSSEIARTKHNFCSKACLYAWQRHWFRCDYCGILFQRPPSYFRKSKHHFCSPQCFGHWKYDNEILKTIDEAPFDWGYLIGITLSDGHLGKLPRCKILTVSSIDLNIIQNFINSASIIVDRNLNFSKGQNPKRQYVASITHGKLLNFLKQQVIYGTFIWEVPQIIRDGSLELKRGFLQGFFDGDGTVKISNDPQIPQLSITGASEKGLMGIQNLLSSMGIDGAIYKHGKYKRLSIYTKQAVILYWDIIGIRLERKKQKFVTGLKAYINKVAYQHYNHTPLILSKELAERRVTV